MCVLLQLFLSLCFVSVEAQFCRPSREFAVDNCTACPTFDQTRHGKIPMAVCEERLADPGSGKAYACVCISFPIGAMIEPLQYFPRTNGNVTWCEEMWATAPVVQTAVTSVSAVVLLYVSAHFLYISLLSRICCCARHGCTKARD